MGSRGRGGGASGLGTSSMVRGPAPVIASPPSATLTPEYLGCDGLPEQRRVERHLEGACLYRGQEREGGGRQVREHQAGLRGGWGARRGRARPRADVGLRCASLRACDTCDTAGGIIPDAADTSVANPDRRRKSGG